MDILYVFTRVFGLFLLVMVGFLCAKLRLFSAAFTHDLGVFVLEAGLPCMIFSSVVQESDPSLAGASLWIFLVTLGFLLFAIVLSKLLARLLRIKDAQRGVWMFSATYSNNGFMGLPIVYALLGEKGLFLAAIMAAAIALLLYSLGVMVVAAQPGKQTRPPLRKVLYSNINIALALGLLFFFTQWPLPDFLYDCIHSFGSITTPLSMVLVGLHMAEGDIWRAFRSKTALGLSAIRLILMPLLAAALAGIFVTPATELAYLVLVVTMAMPVAVIVVVLAEQYNGDVDFATDAVVASTFYSMLTIPLVQWAVRLLFGIS